MTITTRMIRLLAAIMLPVFLAACAGKSVDAVPVSNFNSDRYLGTWYEIARLDHSFERGLSNVTATYGKRPDGQISVINRGFNDKEGKFEQATGRAKFAGDPSTGQLRVSFFGPFYGDYIIFGLGNDYRHAYISGGNDKYLWLLSRSRTVSPTIRRNFIKRANALGYDTSALIWVDQSRSK